MFIDTHCHQYSEKLIDNLEDHVVKAKENGIVKILMPNIDLESIPLMHKIEDGEPTFFESMMGMHPCYVTKNWANELATCKKWLDNRNYCAVGEIGIDLYWDKSLIEEQKSAFRAQLKWAKELGKPVAIHARESFHEIFEIVEEENAPELTGVFHCFTGGMEEAEKIMSFGGFKMGIGGVLTFKKSGLDQVVKNIPLSELVLETDAPYLAPSPHRGKTNEPAFLYHIADKLSDIKEETVQTIGEATSFNACELFSLSL